jgi:hypothetical protein
MQRSVVSSKKSSPQDHCDSTAVLRRTTLAPTSRGLVATHRVDATPVHCGAVVCARTNEVRAVAGDRPTRVLAAASRTDRAGTRSVARRSNLEASRLSSTARRARHRALIATHVVVDRDFTLASEHVFDCQRFRPVLTASASGESDQHGYEPRPSRVIEHAEAIDTRR